MIKLCENWYLDADERQYILINWSGSTKFDKRQKKDVMSGQRYLYYADLSAAMRQLFVQLVRQGIQETKSLQELKHMIENRYALVSDLCANMIPDIVVELKQPD